MPTEANAGAGRLGPLAATASTIVLAAVPAAFWTVALWDRTSLGGVSRYWAGTFLVLAAAQVAWAWFAGVEEGWPAAIGLLPAAVVAVVLLLAIYISGDVHHAFVYQPLLKGLFLPVAGILCLGAPVFAGGAIAWQKVPPDQRVGATVQSLRDVLRRHERLVALLALATAGVLQAVSYCAIATDDSIRYWAVADGLLSGAGYPVTTGAAGSEGFYLVELPLYPLLLIGSFAVAGHRFLALEMPLLAANVALPFVFYALGRAVGASRMGALWLALALLCLPFYQSYALGAAQPEPLLAVELGVALWLVITLTPSPAHSRGERRTLLTWASLGVACAAAVLTRPEGTLYVAPLMVGLAWQERRALLRGQARGPWLAVALFAVPVVAFSTFLWRRFGVLWPAGWTNVAGPQFLATNVRLALRQDLPHYAAVAGLPAAEWSGSLLAAALVALAAAGMWRLCRLRPALWFVPVSCLLNLAVIFASPSYLTLDLFSPATFFRHVSVTFPWLVPGLALLAASAVGRPTAGARRRLRDQPPLLLTPSSFVAALRQGLVSRTWSYVVAAVAAGVLVWELAILGSSAASNQAGRPTALSSDIYVLVSDLVRADDALPALPFTRDAAGVAAVDPTFDYMAFRGRLFASVRPYDLHVDDAGRAHEIATGIVALAGLGALALARHRAATPVPVLARALVRQPA